MSIIQKTEDNLAESEGWIAGALTSGILLTAFGLTIVCGPAGIFIGLGAGAFFMFLGLILEKCATKILRASGRR